MSAAGHIELVCHPSVVPVDPLHVHVSFVRSSDNVLNLSYSLDGSLARLRVPEPRTPQRADGLSQHTCFEAFVSLDGGAAYYEYNFAPSRAWSIYRFSAYRDGMAAVTPARAPEISVRHSAHRLQLDATAALGEIFELSPAGRVRLALAAVVEGADGMLSYWALRHPTGKPDFHHADNFAMTLP
jgi:hypothetical protein